MCAMSSTAMVSCRVDGDGAFEGCLRRIERGGVSRVELPSLQTRDLLAQPSALCTKVR